MASEVLALLVLGKKASKDKNTANNDEGNLW